MPFGASFAHGRVALSEAKPMETSGRPPPRILTPQNIKNLRTHQIDCGGDLGARQALQIK